MTRSHIRVVFGAVALVTIALTHRLLAQPNPGNWGPESCTVTLWNGTTKTVSCTVSYTTCATYCRWYHFGVCFDPTPPPCPGYARYRYCLKICDSNGNVVNVKCVCACAGNAVPYDDNCTAEP